MCKFYFFHILLSICTYSLNVTSEGVYQFEYGFEKPVYVNLNEDLFGYYFFQQENIVDINCSGSLSKKILTDFSSDCFVNFSLTANSLVLWVMNRNVCNNSIFYTTYQQDFFMFHSIDREISDSYYGYCMFNPFPTYPVDFTIKYNSKSLELSVFTVENNSKSLDSGVLCHDITYDVVNSTGHGVRFKDRVYGPFLVRSTNLTLSDSLLIRYSDADVRNKTTCSVSDVPSFSLRSLDESEIYGYHFYSCSDKSSRAFMYYVLFFVSSSVVIILLFVMSFVEKFCASPRID